jgi:hypothetical protein
MKSLKKIFQLLKHSKKYQQPKFRLLHHLSLPQFWPNKLKQYSKFSQFKWLSLVNKFKQYNQFNRYSKFRRSEFSNCNQFNRSNKFNNNLSLLK